MYKLEDINGIGKSTLARMKASGINSVETLASVKVEDLLEIKGIGIKTAVKYITQAKNLIHKRIKEIGAPPIDPIHHENDKLQTMDEMNYLMPTAIKDIQNNKNIVPTIEKTDSMANVQIFKDEMKLEQVPSEQDIPLKTIEDFKKKLGSDELFGQKVALEAFDTIEKKEVKKTVKKNKKVKLRKVKVPPSKPPVIAKQKPMNRNLKRASKPLKSASKPLKSASKSLKSTSKPLKSASKPLKSLKKEEKKGKKPFFKEELAQKIRFLHFKINHIEDELEKEYFSFSADDIEIFHEYISILNIDYKNKSQRGILTDLTITSYFQDPIENNKIEIYDLMLECARVLFVAARAYEQFSISIQEKEQDWKNAIIAMSESSKLLKAASYFSTAAIHQRNTGITLSAENLELRSEEIRAKAQKIAADNERNKKNYNLASNLYAGLSALSKRIYYLKKYDEKKRNLIQAKYHYEIGLSCHLKARALNKAPSQEQEIAVIRQLQQKANYYFFQAEEIWETMLKNKINLTLEEKEDLNSKLSLVNKNIIKNEVEILEYEKVKKIQDPEPIIIIPENIAPIIPKSTRFMTRYKAKDLNVERYMRYNVKKLEERVTYSKKEELLIKKVAILRTINVLEELYDKNEIKVDKFIELLEKYSLKQEKIEYELENIDK